MKDRKHSKLYQYIEQLQDIEQLQGEGRWGRLLDAGTGANSIRWISELATDQWTAVTGSTKEADLAHKAVGAAKRPQDQILIGNWADDQLLKGEVYDIVLADYLLGAIEGFAPYFQYYLFARLRPLTGRALYVTGLEPYVPTAPPRSQAGRLVWEIGRFRDACVLLKGGVPYREYPAQRVVEQLKHSGFAVRNMKHFKIGYKDAFVNAQIDIAVHGLDRLGDKALAKALKEHGETLRSQALEFVGKEGALRACSNYVIAADPV